MEPSGTVVQLVELAAHEVWSSNLGPDGTRQKLQKDSFISFDNFLLSV